MQPFRVTPKLGPESYKTYAIGAPLATHTRPASCAEVECPNRERGFKVIADVSTALGTAQAKYIIDRSGRSFTKTHVGTTVTFTFPAGQECFTSHRVSNGREPLYVVKGGDYRGNPTGTPTVSRKAEEWVDDFANHQDRIAEARKRG